MTKQNHLAYHYKNLPIYIFYRPYTISIRFYNKIPLWHAIKFLIVKLGKDKLYILLRSIVFNVLLQSQSTFYIFLLYYICYDRYYFSSITSPFGHENRRYERKYVVWRELL